MPEYGTRMCSLSWMCLCDWLIASGAVVEAEKGNEDIRIEVMFDRLMLLDLRKNVGKLDTRAYAELKSYAAPPKVIHNILKSTLSLFYPEKAKNNELEDWGYCKQVGLYYLSVQCNVFSNPLDWRKGT